MSKEKGKYLTELRRSNAAGIHVKNPSRAELRRNAITEGLDGGPLLRDTEISPVESEADAYVKEDSL